LADSLRVASIARRDRDALSVTSPRLTVEVAAMERTTAILSTQAPDDLRPSDVRDRVRAALEANAAELAARRRWAAILGRGRPAPSQTRDAWARHLLETLPTLPPAA
jgi:hypothetical protein